MKNKSLVFSGNPTSKLPVLGQVKQGISYLNENQLTAITQEFSNYYQRSTSSWGKTRGRHFLIFLLLRFTGARLSEILAVDDNNDIDFRAEEILLATLKQRPGKRANRRVIPIPSQVISEIALYLASYPQMKGKVLRIHRTAFFKVFQELCKSAGIDRSLAHPHILRHTRAIELLRAGVPVTIVQEILGHSTLNTTAVYLRFTAEEKKIIMREKGMI